MSEHQNGDKFLRRVMVGVLIGIILNIPITIWWAATLNTQVNNLEAKVDKNTLSIEKLEETVMNSMDDRYRGTDAKEDFKIRDDRLEKLESRIRRTEAQLARIP